MRIVPRAPLLIRVERKREVEALGWKGKNNANETFFLKDCVSPHCNILIAEYITLVDFSLRILPLILSLSLSP